MPRSNLIHSDLVEELRISIADKAARALTEVTAAVDPTLLFVGNSAPKESRDKQHNYLPNSSDMLFHLYNVAIIHPFRQVGHRNPDMRRSYSEIT